MRPVAKLLCVWLALLILIVLWTNAASKVWSLSDTSLVYVPAAIVFVTLLLTLHRTAIWTLSRWIHVLATMGLALVLTCVLMWLWFIVSWSIAGGAP